MADLPAVYKRTADAVMSQRLCDLEAIAIQGFLDAQGHLVRALSALAEIRDSNAFLEEQSHTDTGLRPLRPTFEAYLTAFIARLREVHPSLAVSEGYVAERLRWHRRFVAQLGMDAERVLSAPTQAIRNIERMARFDADGKVLSLADGLNSGALPSDYGEATSDGDRLSVIMDTMMDVHATGGTMEAIGFTKSVINEAEIRFERGPVSSPRSVTAVVVSPRAGQEAYRKYPWYGLWPSDVTEEYFRRLKA